jgi:hypothetical protein
MNAVEAIQHVRDVLSETKKRGVDAVQIEAFDNFLEDFSKGAPTMGAEEAKRRTTVDIERWKIQNTFEVEMFKAVIEAGQTALRSALLINGAAAALLAFLGNLLTKTPSANSGTLVSGVGFALLIFVCSLGSAGVASGFRYLSQFCYAHQNGDCANSWIAAGHVMNFTSVALGVASFGGFWVATWHIDRSLRCSTTAFSRAEVRHGQQNVTDGWWSGR